MVVIAYSYVKLTSQPNLFDVELICYVSNKFLGIPVFAAIWIIYSMKQKPCDFHGPITIDIELLKMLKCFSIFWSNVKRDLSAILRSAWLLVFAADVAESLT